MHELGRIAIRSMDFQAAIQHFTRGAALATASEVLNSPYATLALALTLALTSEPPRRRQMP